MTWILAHVYIYLIITVPSVQKSPLMLSLCSHSLPQPPALADYWFLLWNPSVFFLKRSCENKYAVHNFSMLLFSLIIIWYSFKLLHVSCLLLYSIPLCVCTTICLFLHLCGIFGLFSLWGYYSCMFIQTVSYLNL